MVLTKVDKTRPEALAEVSATTLKEISGHTAAHPTVIATSAAIGQGIAELRAELAALALA
ncbi:hypothetical protein D3C83_204720 [compost metagenome]